MTVLNTLSEPQSVQGESVVQRPIRFLKKSLDKMYSWNNWANVGSQTRNRGSNSYKDRSPTRGSGHTDYAKPVWRR